MRFIDYNDTGELDTQDIATSIVVEKAADNSVHEAGTDQNYPDNNVGCSTIAALVALPLLILISAL